MAAVFLWLRGAFNRFVDDGGLYSTYNGERPFERTATPNLKHLAKRTKPSRWLATHKA